MRGRLSFHELAVQEQAGEQESHGKNEDDELDVCVRVPLRKAVGHGCQGYEHEPDEYGAAVEPLAIEGQDEGEKIKAEWQHPEERNRGHVLREMVRD